jgi:hypothetical protein
MPNRTRLATVFCPPGVFSCPGLLCKMPVRNGLMLLGWTVIGFAACFSYGCKYSELRQVPDTFVTASDDAGTPPTADNEPHRC